MKKYISNLLPETIYSEWLSGEKLIINAPTGTGKTKFILEVFLPYCKQRGKKMLILCNRRLLSDQYKFDLAERYFRFVEMEEDLDVWTYQEVAERVKKCSNIRMLFEGYDVVVCDEVHYFYADSDFNPFGTYVLLQAIVLAAFYKTVIMITATLDEVLPLIRETFRKCKRKLESLEGHLPSFHKCCFSDHVYDFQYLAEFEHFQCCYVADVASLAEIIGKSERKSLIFIDDKAKAEKFKALLIENGMSCGSIYLLNSQVLDERSTDEVIATLCGTNKLLPKVLITTSVLDNGVSVHDSDVGNLVIATESRVSFLQMIGRIRSENCASCNLFLFPRDAKYYKRRIEQGEKKMKFFRELSNAPLEVREFDILSDGWYGNDEYAEFLRNAVVLTNDSWEYYGTRSVQISLKRGEITLAVNEFAKEKMGNQLNVEKVFYKLALDSPQKVAEKQISWIGKTPDELHVFNSSYLDKMKKSLIKELLSVKGYSNDELKKKKNNIAKNFRKEFFADLVAKNESFSTKKLCQICDRFGLKLTEKLGKDKRKLYSIVEIDDVSDS